MPRRIAARQPGSGEDSELSYAEMIWIEWETEIWKMTHPRKPVPDFAQRHRDRRARGPRKPVDPKTPEGRALITKLRARDEKLRQKLYREKETK